MSRDIITTEVVDGSALTKQDRIVFGVQSAVANAAGGGAGQAVVTAVAFLGKPLPANYAVNVTPSQDATAFVTAKTNTGFNVTLTPRLAASTLAAGTFDVTVFG